MEGIGGSGGGGMGVECLFSGGFLLLAGKLLFWGVGGWALGSNSLKF